MELCYCYKIATFTEMKNKEQIDSFFLWARKFAQKEKTAGLVLLISAIVAIFLANSPWRGFYHRFWEIPFGIEFSNFRFTKPLHFWVNEGLMTLFFFFVGLELKREFKIGVLSSLRSASLPFSAAIGGMLVPAILFLLVNHSFPDNIHGWAISSATDIAFALGLSSLLGNRIPTSFKILLTAIAVADDLGAVLIIAFFYTDHIVLEALLFALAFFIILLASNYIGIRNISYYGILGIGGLWVSMLVAGIHTTIAGVLVAFLIPARVKVDRFHFTKASLSFIRQFQSSSDGKGSFISGQQLLALEKMKHLTRHAHTPLQRLEHTMKPLVNFLVLPLFALANAGVELPNSEGLLQPVTIGVFLGLVLGKFIGVGGVSWLMVKLKWADLPKGLHSSWMIPLSMLAGVGFTMSLFIADLAFHNSPVLVEEAKAGIIIASFTAGSLGMFLAHNRLKSKS